MIATWTPNAASGAKNLQAEVALVSKVLSVISKALQHNHDFFESVCFAPGTDQITKLSIISGG